MDHAAVNNSKTFRETQFKFGYALFIQPDNQHLYL